MPAQWKAERVFVGNEPDRYRLFPVPRVWGAPALADFGTDAAAATLTAAAPDLLESLKFCAAALEAEAGKLYAAHLEQARQAIAKATGSAGHE